MLEGLLFVSLGSPLEQGYLSHKRVANLERRLGILGPNIQFHQHVGGPTFNNESIALVSLIANHTAGSTRTERGTTHI